MVKQIKRLAQVPNDEWYQLLSRLAGLLLAGRVWGCQMEVGGGAAR